MKPYSKAVRNLIPSFSLIAVTLWLTGCASSNTPEIKSTPFAGQSAPRNIDMGTGSNLKPSLSSGGGSNIVNTSEQQETIRRKQEFEQDVQKQQMSQAFQASEAAKDRQLEQSKMLAVMAMHLFPVQAMVLMTSQKSGKCIPKDSTLKSLISDSKAIFDTTSPQTARTSEHPEKIADLKSAKSDGKASEPVPQTTPNPRAVSSAQTAKQPISTTGPLVDGGI